MLPENEASKKAKQVLKDFNIPTDDLYLGKITYMTVQKGAQNIPLKQMVYFIQKLDGQPLYGVARVVVMFGDNGRLVGLYNLRKDFELASELPLKDVSTAYSEIKKKGLINASDGDKKGTFTNVKIAYWATPGNDQQYIQPVYQFSGTTTNDHKFHAYVPAVDEDFETPSSTESINPKNVIINPPKATSIPLQQSN